MQIKLTASFLCVSVIYSILFVLKIMLHVVLIIPKTNKGIPKDLTKQNLIKNAKKLAVLLAIESF